MSVTRNATAGHSTRDRAARARRGPGFAMVATLTCAALLTAWPTPRYSCPVLSPADGELLEALRSDSVPRRGGACP